MKNLKTIFIASALLTLGSFASAQTEVPNTFEAGTAATAASVNANFDTLITAINDLSAEIDALQAAAPTNDVAGRSYALVSIYQFVENQTTADSPNDVYLSNFGLSEADLSFGTNGTVTVGTQTFKEQDLGWNTTSGQPFLGAVNEGTDPEVTFDYTQDGGAIDIPEIGAEFYASKDGSILIWADYSTDPAEDNNAAKVEQSLTIMVELDIAQ